MPLPLFTCFVVLVMFEKVMQTSMKSGRRSHAGTVNEPSKSSMTW